MKKDHGAFYNINLILIINLLERKQILKLIANIKSGENDEKKKSVSDAEVQTDTVYQPISEDDIVVIDSGHPVPKPIMITETNTPINAQIEEIRRFLGQISDGSEQLTNIAETMDISDENPTVVTNISTSTQGSFELEVPSDFELEEAIPMSTPKSNKVKKVKREFIEPNPNLDPIEVMLEGEDEFNILDMTNDDFVLTAGGPQPIQDYASFVPGSVIPLSYNPMDSLEPVSQNFSIPEEIPENSFTNPVNTVSDDFNKSIQDVLQLENMNYTNIENLIEKKTSKDMLTIYLQNCSEYFKKFPKQIVSASQERALRFTETDPTLPAGWKVKTFDRKTGKSTGRQDKEFLSPELKVFRSRIAVLEYMKAMGGYTEEEMFKVVPIKVKKEKK